MQYILILWVLWIDPFPHFETLVIEPFNTITDCFKAGTRIGDATEADGAVGYTISCRLSSNMKV
jgi:hypothetical protein